MADGVTQISDVVVPEQFTPYIRQLTEDKTRLIQSGVISRDAFIDQLLAGGGLTFNVPSWRDLDNDAENISTDDIADRIAATIAAAWPSPSLDSSPKKLGSDTEIAVRLSRNNSWGSADLTAALAGEDPMSVIGDRISTYWMRRLQAVFIATWLGVSKDNATNDGGDYANDIAGASFVDGVTNFSAEAFIDTGLTMGDSASDLAAIMVHSVVMARMKKNNLIDFIPDARGEVQIPTFLGHEVIEDDNMPIGTNVVRDDGSPGVAGMYESWIFANGATRLGVNDPKVATEVERQASAGNGGGAEVLHSRTEWAMHPVGHAYTGSAPNGGPSNAASVNNLNDAGSWNRVYQERKQIKFARLISRESS